MLWYLRFSIFYIRYLWLRPVWPHWGYLLIQHLVTLIASQLLSLRQRTVKFAKKSLKKFWFHFCLDSDSGFFFRLYFLCSIQANFVPGHRTTLKGRFSGNSECLLCILLSFGMQSCQMKKIRKETKTCFASIFCPFVFYQKSN